MKKLTILIFCLNMQVNLIGAENFYEKCGLSFVLKGISNPDIKNALEAISTFVPQDQEKTARRALIAGLKCIRQEDPNNEQIDIAIKFAKSMLDQTEPKKERTMGDNSGAIMQDQSPAEAIAILRQPHNQTPLITCFLNQFTNGNTSDPKDVLLPNNDTYNASIKKAVGTWWERNEPFSNQSDDRLVRCMRQHPDPYAIQRLQSITHWAASNGQKTADLIARFRNQF